MGFPPFLCTFDLLCVVVARRVMSPLSDLIPSGFGFWVNIFFLVESVSLEETEEALAPRRRWRHQHGHLILLSDLNLFRRQRLQI
jgi:hypothetical protein